MTFQGVFTNRLIEEKSPYLLQHAHNPVEWYPWGDEAFQKAQNEDKSIFLSIGYSSCHWCHVMERESFNDREVAEVLNRHYVSIKVDREERPDIDRYYMNGAMTMTGVGGWPLTVIMTPEKKPFFSATYLPKQSMRGHVGLVELLRTVAGEWRDNRERLLHLSGKIASAIGKERAAPEKGGLSEETLRIANRQLVARFDERHGGFEPPPKFPTPHYLSFLLRWWKRSGDEQALEMVEKSLERMARGGVHDQLGGGFHRYSVDSEWLVPHFEKMLYDQALIAIALAETFQVTGKDFYRKIAGNIFTYVERDMTSPEGAFCSAEDADSEGGEGRYYLWTPGEVEHVLGKQDGELISAYYGVTLSGNFEDGKSILHVAVAPDEFVKLRGISLSRFRRLCAKSMHKLLRHREKRIHPYKDNKVLADWNGLMIAALAKGGRVFNEQRYTAAAARAADFILDEMRTGSGRLLHRYREGEAAIPAFLDDYAFFTWGLLELYGVLYDPRYLDAAMKINTGMQTLFWDDKQGGFYHTGSDSDELPVRSKELYDGAVPSGNSVAALNLLRLAALTGDRTLLEKSSILMDYFSGMVGDMPVGYTQFLIALDYALGPRREVVIASGGKNGSAKAMLSEINSRFLPKTVVLYHPGGSSGRALETLAPFVKECGPVNGSASAYVCRDNSCSLPLTSSRNLSTVLEER